MGCGGSKDAGTSSSDVVLTAEVPAQETEPAKRPSRSIGSVAAPVAEPGDSEASAASKVQSMQRGKAARKQLAAEQDAAKKVQAIQRGNAARKAAAEVQVEEPAEEPEEVPQPRSWRDSLTDLGDRMSRSIAGVFGSAKEDDDEEQAQAATQMQAVMRGRQARKEAKEAADTKAAATKVQAIARGKKAREAAAAGKGSDAVKVETEEETSAIKSVPVNKRGSLVKMKTGVPKGSEMADPATALVQGVLRKKGSAFPYTWRTRYMLFFSDRSVWYYESEADIAGLPSVMGKPAKGMISVTGVSETSLDAGTYSFSFDTAESSMPVQAETGAELKRWVDALNKFFAQ